MTAPALRLRLPSLVAALVAAVVLAIGWLGPIGLHRLPAAAASVTGEAPSGSIGTTSAGSTNRCADAASRFTTRDGDGPVGLWRATSALFATDFGAGGGNGRILRFATPTAGPCPAGEVVTTTAGQPLTGYGPEAVTLSADEARLFVSWTEWDPTSSGQHGVVDVYVGSGAHAGGGFAHYDLEQRLTTENGVAFEYPRGLGYDDATGLLYIADDQNDRIAVFKKATTWDPYDAVSACGCLTDVKGLAVKDGKVLVTSFHGSIAHPGERPEWQDKVLRFDGPWDDPSVVHQPSMQLSIGAPLDVAWAADGTFLVGSGTDEAAHRYDATGTTRLTTYAGVVGDPFGLAAGADGFVHVADGRGDRVLTWAPAPYVPLTPARIVDSRPGAIPTDGVEGALTDGTTVSPVVTGVGGVPATGVGAVAINVTVTGTTQASFLTVWPTGRDKPVASNLNWTTGQTVPNLVVATVGSGGRASFFNLAGRADLIVDVVGWFPASGGGFTGLTPHRDLDTRSSAPLGPAGHLDLTVTGTGGVPATGVGAIVANVTVTSPTADGYLTVWPTGAAQPTASNLNWVAGHTVANLVVATVGTGGKISLFNFSGNAHVIVDVVGWFASPSAFTGLTPHRDLDTRGGPPLHAGEARDLVVTGVGGVPPSGVSAVVVNVTATATTAAGYLTVWPTGAPRPTASNLNWAAGQTVPNLVIAKVGSGGRISLFDFTGDAHVIVDVVGWFASPATTTSPVSTSSSSSSSTSTSSTSSSSTSSSSSSTTSTTTAPAGPTPVDPSASAAAKRVLTALAGAPKKADRTNALALGQAVDAYNEPVDGNDWGKPVSGLSKQPALITVGDLDGMTRDDQNDLQSRIDQLTTWAKTPGTGAIRSVPIITFGPRNPLLTADDAIGAYPNDGLEHDTRHLGHIGDVLVNGSTARTTWLAEIDGFAPTLKKLSDNGVPVILRPLRESNADFFWWGPAAPGTNDSTYQAAFRAAWLDLVARFEADGVHNVLYGYSSAAPSSFNAYDDPTKQVPGAGVDIVGMDVYDEDCSSRPAEAADHFPVGGSVRDDYAGLTATGKPFGFFEAGPFGSDGAWNPDIALNDAAEGIKAHYPKSAFFSFWFSDDTRAGAQAACAANGDFVGPGIKSLKDLQSPATIVNDPWVATAGELPF